MPTTFLEPSSHESIGVKPRIVKHGYVRFLSLADMDGRTRAAARCKELRQAFESDLGGADQLSTARAQLVQRAAILGAQCEDFETRFALGMPVELTDYFTAVNVQRRVLVTLGIERRARDVSPAPSLSEYLRTRSIDADEPENARGEANGATDDAPGHQAIGVQEAALLDAAPTADGPPPVASNGSAPALAAGGTEDAIGGETSSRQEGGT
jgi:hypothetical protein